MKKFYVQGFYLFLLLCISACTSGPVETPLVDKTIIENARDSFPDLNSAQFGPALNVETESQILDLSESQVKHFLDYYNHHSRARTPGHERLYRYLQDIGEVFVYKSQTFNAETTLRTKSGNCMSLAVLTTALARVADVTISYQLVNRLPVYQEFGSVIFNAQHIRSVVYSPRAQSVGGVQSGLYFWENRAVIDYYPSRYTYVDKRINKEEFLASYYRNVAAEALANDQHAKSFWFLISSLEFEPENAEAINSLAVLNRRIGDFKVAEELYKYGIKNASNKIALLRNYHILLTVQKRTEDAARVAKELENLDDLNPFSWLHAANDAFEESDYAAALKLYKKATEIAPYLHQGYFGIAKSEYKRGNIFAANRALEKAKEEAFDHEDKTLYEAKLAAMGRERYN